MYVNKVAHDVLDSYIFLSQSYFRKGIEYFLCVYVASFKHLIEESKDTHIQGGGGGSVAAPLKTPTPKSLGGSPKALPHNAPP